MEVQFKQVQDLRQFKLIIQPTSNSEGSNTLQALRLNLGGNSEEGDPRIPQ